MPVTWFPLVGRRVFELLKQTAKAPQRSFPSGQFGHSSPLVAAQRNALSPHPTDHGGSSVPPAPSRFAAPVEAISSLATEEEGEKSVCLFLETASQFCSDTLLLLC